MKVFEDHKTSKRFSDYYEMLSEKEQPKFGKMVREASENKMMGEENHRTFKLTFDELNDIIREYELT